MGLGRPEMVQALVDSAAKSWLKDISLTVRQDTKRTEKTKKRRLPKETAFF
jgi:hypothetical protein